MSSPRLPPSSGVPYIPDVHTYPRRYALRTFDEQVVELRRWFPRLDIDAAWRRVRGPFSEVPVPAHAEGLFCFISPSFFGSRETGIREALAALREQRRGRFRNYHDGRLSPLHLRVRSKTQRLLTHVAIEQPGDLWVGYAQFGGYRRGKPTVQHPLEHEFNLDLLSVASMVLSHPRRFVHDTDLHANCGGETFRPHVTKLLPRESLKQSFLYTPFFQFVRGKLRFDAYPTDTDFRNDGAVTALYPY